MNPQDCLLSYDLDHVFEHDSLIHSIHMLCTQLNAMQVASGKLQVTG